MVSLFFGSTFFLTPSTSNSLGLYHGRKERSKLKMAWAIIADYLTLPISSLFISKNPWKNS